MFGQSPLSPILVLSRRWLVFRQRSTDELCESHAGWLTGRGGLVGHCLSHFLAPSATVLDTVDVEVTLCG